jgi:membrane-associated protein
MFNAMHLLAINVFDVNHLVASGGILLVSLIVFAEVGLLLGFFLPGDTLLIAAGIFAASGKISIVPLVIATCVAAILGDNTGYYIGNKLGPRLFKKKDSLIFQKEHIVRSEKFFAKYGSKTLLISHALPIIRTFVPVLAGAGSMSHKRFFIFNAIGDIAWAVIVILIGYYFGSRIPNIDHYIMLVIIGVVSISIASPLYHLASKKLKNRQFADKKSDS